MEKGFNYHGRITLSPQKSSIMHGLVLISSLLVIYAVCVCRKLRLETRKGEGEMRVQIEKMRLRERK